MELFFNPFDSLLCILLGISFTVWFTLLLVFIIVPAILGVSFGIRRLYMKSLLKVFEVMEPFRILSPLVTIGGELMICQSHTLKHTSIHSLRMF